MSKIFISYRRQDSALIVGHIYEHLVREFGVSNVFYDIEDIPKGEKFPEVLRQKVASCDVLLAIIGSQWVTIADENGNKRLFVETDYVRYEVDTALRIPTIRVIPILLGDTEMPTKAELPHALQPLCDLNAMRIRSYPDFRRDVDDLIRIIKPRKSRITAVLGIVLTLIIIGVIILAPRFFPLLASTATKSATSVLSKPTVLLTDTSFPTYEPSKTPTPTARPSPSHVPTRTIIPNTVIRLSATPILPTKTSAKPTITPTNQSPIVRNGWRRYTGKGIGIQLPNTYVGTELGSDPKEFTKLLRSLGPDFEAVATLLEQNPDILSFIAVNVGGDGSSRSSVIVVSIPMPTQFSLETLMNATVNQLPSGSKVLEQGTVQIGDYEAGRMIVQTKVDSTISNQLQYYIIQNKTLYLVGFTGTSEDFDLQVESFEQSMSTFEILAKTSA